MRILIIGGSGMLGHQLWLHFSREHETWVTLRRRPEEFRQYGIQFDPSRTATLTDAADFDALSEILSRVRPDVVLNCVGIIKQLKEATAPIPSISINSLLPHRLAERCSVDGARLILFSTDCVFSGRRGRYTEEDISDAEDLYGRTKSLGEVTGLKNVLTLRSSIIGRELGTEHSLVDWFLSQPTGPVKGYTKAVYTGFSTLEMARIVDTIITRQPSLFGLWQVASNPITKYDLLVLLRRHFGRDIQIEPFDGVVCDRSLNGARFLAATGYQPPSWEEMIYEMAVLHRRS